MGVDHNAFSAGCDLTLERIFVYGCVQGKYQAIKMYLETANRDMKERKGKVGTALVHLLESRVTSTQITPLLSIVSLGKGLKEATSAERFRILCEDHLKIVRLLLLYGARPDCKDVCGKTVCHYGAGVMATPTTMEVVRMCSAAYQSSHFFGKEVLLQGLNSEHLNGKRAIARGFVTESGRRVVYLIEDEK